MATGTKSTTVSKTVSGSSLVTYYFSSNDIKLTEDQIFTRFKVGVNASFPHWVLINNGSINQDTWYLDKTAIQYDPTNGTASITIKNLRSSDQTIGIILTIEYRDVSTVGRHNGTTFEKCSLNYYDGNDFVKCEPFVYDGSSWKQCDQ